MTTIFVSHALDCIKIAGKLFDLNSGRVAGGGKCDNFSRTDWSNVRVARSGNKYYRCENWRALWGNTILFVTRLVTIVYQVVTMSNRCLPRTVVLQQLLLVMHGVLTVMELCRGSALSVVLHLPRMLKSAQENHRPSTGRDGPSGSQYEFGFPNLCPRESPGQAACSPPP